MKDINKLTEGTDITAEEMNRYLEDAGLNETTISDIMDRNWNAQHPNKLRMTERELKQVAWAWGQAYNN